MATQPVDTIKTLMQSNLGGTTAGKVHKGGASEPGIGCSSQVFKDYWSTARHVVRSEGPGALWRGLAPRGARTVGATFILSYVNESAGDAIVGWRRAAGEGGAAGVGLD